MEGEQQPSRLRYSPIEMPTQVNGCKIQARKQIGDVSPTFAWLRAGFAPQASGQGRDRRWSLVVLVPDLFLKPTVSCTTGQRKPKW